MVASCLVNTDGEGGDPVDPGEDREDRILLNAQAEWIVRETTVNLALSTLKTNTVLHTQTQDRTAPAKFRSAAWVAAGHIS